MLDPAPDELAVAAAAGMETIAGFAEDFDPGERRWDLVLLCQTIDHLLDVRATLESMRRMTAADGHAFVDVLDLLIARAQEGHDRGRGEDRPPVLPDPRHGASRSSRASGFEPVAERLSARRALGLPARAGASRASRTGTSSSRGAAAMIEELRVAMRALGLVPARGGSTRVPRKNLALLGGRTLVRRALETALAAGCFDTVALSSATTTRSSPRRAGSTSSRCAGRRSSRPRPPVRGSSRCTRSSELGDFDALAIVQCTSPFTAPEDIAGAVELLERTRRRVGRHGERRGRRTPPAEDEAARRRPPASRTSRMTG